jgi:sugar O-acyltransferase (sialic acid O-acetyltransferase NeuD family)
MSQVIVVYAVASPYAWDVVETAGRGGLDPLCVDNLGSADPRLPLHPVSPDLLTRDFVLGLSSADGRSAAARAAYTAGFRTPVSLVDPTAAVATTAVLSHGAYVNAGAVVASHATIGCHANINRSASIGHDCSLGFATSIGPGAVLTGGVVVGAGAFVGAGATVLPNLTIGFGAIVGAGSVVTKSVEPLTIVVGNPATTLRTRDLAAIEDTCPHCATAA